MVVCTIIYLTRVIKRAMFFQDEASASIMNNIHIFMFFGASRAGLLIFKYQLTTYKRLIIIEPTHARDIQ